MTNFKPYMRFVLVIIVSHVIAYLFAGGIAYQLITKELWEGENPLLSKYLRIPGNEELWNNAMLWQIPGQLLRAFFIALVMLQLYQPVKE